MACKLPSVWKRYLSRFVISTSHHGHAVTLSLFFSLFSTDLSVCICLFICICLSVYESVLWFVSEYFQQSLIFSLCLWLSLSLCYTYCHCTSSAHSPPPPPTLSMVQWCPLLSNCGIYMQYRIVIFHSSEGCATFSISGSGVWDNACYRLLVNTTSGKKKKKTYSLLSQNYIKIEVTSHFYKLWFICKKSKWLVQIMNGNQISNMLKSNAPRNICYPKLQQDVWRMASSLWEHTVCSLWD